MRETEKTERAGAHAVAHDVLHGGDLGVRRRALLALVAHDIVADRGVADEIADIDPEIAVEFVDVLRHRFPVEIDGAQHLHRDRFDIGQELRQPFRFPGRTGASDNEQLPKITVVAP